MLSSKELRELSKAPAFLAEMQDIFFEAMNAGYAADAPKKQSISWLPDNKTIEYKRGPWRAVDTYHVTKLGPRSGGTTIISYEETPVWMMQYFGEYEEEAIPCLKAALRSTYSRKEFWAGRGPWRFELDGFVYKNCLVNPLGLSSFAGFFSGEEKVFNKSKGGILGWHRYQGGGML